MKKWVLKCLDKAIALNSDGYYVEGVKEDE